MRRGTILFFLFILVLGAAAIYIDNPNTPGIHIGGYSNNLTVRQGLDLQGGIQIVMKAHCPQDQPKCTISQDDMTAVIANLNRRISQGLAVNEAVVRQEGNDRVLIELPGLKDDQQALALLGKTGQMNIIDTGGNYVPPNTNVANQTCTTNCKAGQYKVVFTGSQLNTNQISATIDQQTGKPIVTFAFAGSAQKAFADYTRNNIGRYLTITLDNVVIESATIQNEIAGNGQITGIPSVAQAQNLATLLKYGALRVPSRVNSS
jgi:preprotein translocase subunit SecD